VTNLKNLLRRFPLSAVAACVVAFAPNAWSAPKPPAPLIMVHRFKLPSYVTGRFDHFGVDLTGNRLFLAAESMHEVLVLNLSTGTVIHRLSGIDIPHAIVYREAGNRIYVTDGGAGALKVFNGKTYRLVKSIKLQLDADSIAYDQTMRYLYIVNGGEDAHQPNSLVSVIDTNTDTKVGEVTISSPHVEAMAVDTASSHLYVNNTGKNQVDVIDREKYRFVASWPVNLCKQNVPVALDEANNRLFIGCRSGEISIFDTQTGKEIQGLPIGKGIDDLNFDSKNKRIYASCGTDGQVYVFQQKSADNYEALGSVPSGPGARNSRYIASLRELYVSVPAHQGAAAEVLVYRDR
jgi:DNA-binding beta-propeller fold protein YncE